MLATNYHRMEESTDRSSGIPSSALSERMILQECQAARRRPQERAAALEDSLTYKIALLEHHKMEASNFDTGLKKCNKDKAAVARKCAKLENEMMKLTIPYEESMKTEESTGTDELMASGRVKLDKPLGQTEVSMGTAELKDYNKKKSMVASASIQLENLMANTRKLAAEFASLKLDLESMMINFKRAEEEKQNEV